MKKLICIFLFCIFAFINYTSAFALKNDELIKLKVEIAGMVAKDQEIRFIVLDMQKKYGSDFLDKNPNVIKIWQETDEKNSNRIDQILSKYGWLTTEVVGKKCNNAIWLLVQHSDRNLRLQENALKQIEKFSIKNKQDLKNYAYLYDRIQMNKKMPQRYGTQGKCHKAHDWQPFAIEDYKKLDTLRTSVGLGPFDEYRKIVSKFCF